VSDPTRAVMPTAIMEIVSDVLKRLLFIELRACMKISLYISVSSGIVEK
jgi:hypothetical protein